MGAVGMWNFLWRLGFAPHLPTRPPTSDPGAPGLLFVQIDGVPTSDETRHVRQWLAGGGRLVIAGSPEGWSRLALDGREWDAIRPENPYAGLGYRLPDGSVSLVAPAGWRFGRRRGEHGEVAGDLGQIGIVGGERQTPGRALVHPVTSAPAVAGGERFAYLNGDPFAALQSWLQGQETLRPWLGWRHRLFWLDEWISEMAGLLADLRLLDLAADRPGIRGLGPTTVVLRHDVDYSRDTLYLEEEEKLELPGTHAILLDRNRRFWLERLARSPSQEAAFHYETGTRDWVGSLANRLGSAGGGIWKPWPRRVTGKGLLRQVRRARSRGIPVATLHRHLAFLIYPEWVDALDAVYDEEPDVLGSSSIFRGAPLRWGTVVSETSEWPDVETPFWFPFRLCNAARDGRILRGWESVSLMEPEPRLVLQLLRHTVKHLPQRVFTLNFHPAHAQAPTFASSGSSADFRRTLQILADLSIDVRTLREVYARATDGVS